MGESKKSVCVAYFLWLFGGYFGWHLFYLGRDKQGFVWFATWGGFSIGWLRDLFCIPGYVGLYNNETHYIAQAKAKERRKLAPSWSAFRFFGEVAFGSSLAFLAQYAIPDELLEIKAEFNPVTYILLLVGPLAAGIGVYVVANIGREQCSWVYPVISAFLPLPLIYMAPMNLFYSPIASAVVKSYFGSKWRPLYALRPRKHFCKRFPLITACCMMYLSLWGSMIYFNASITTKEGDEVKVREAINNFFRSPAWLEMKEIMGQLYQNIQNVGWQKFFEDFIDALDPQGESNALKVLGLDANATQKEITAKYRKLAKTWHPDRHKDPKDKEDAQKKFIEIQQAYDILSDIKTKRNARAKKTQPA